MSVDSLFVSLLGRLLGLGFEIELQLLELLDDFFSVLAQIEFGLNVGDFSLFVHENCGSLRTSPFAIKNSIGGCNPCVGIAKQRVIQIQFFIKLFVLFGSVTACAKVGDIKLAKLYATLTE